ncbi:FkbM family methyltransferase [Streptomyces pristinaespiralis]|uniref:FkbM family methyltransferase n=1 Tax=Streptomyces pristinaespiralis TaxID=38300 RepID=UPI0037AF9679
MTTLAAAVASRLPTRWVGSAACALYPRFEPELSRLADFCPRGGTAIDIGGWYGPWSRRLAARCERVVTLEPVPHLARHLRSTLPGNARVVQAAAGDREGTARLWLPAGDRGDRGVSSLARREIHSHSVDVRTVTVDSLGLRGVRFVKVDVDGEELAALLGASGLLRRDRPALLVELETRIRPIAPVVALLTGQGYRGWVLAARSWMPLADFDLAGHQSRTEHLVHRGLLRRALIPRDGRYINSVLFLPDGRVPGGTAAP